MTMNQTASTMTEYPSWPKRPATVDLYRAQQAVRIHGMSDPLGAKGFRQSRARIEREGRVRRLAAIGAIASFVASLILIVRDAPQSTPASGAASARNPVSIEQVIEAEDRTASLGARPPGLVRPTQVPVQSHTRTRSSG
jgi:hypothetical protein